MELVEQLKEISQVTNRNTLKDTAVGIADVGQSILSIPLALAPGHKLSDSNDRSQWLDQHRSPGYLLERERDAAKVAEVTAAEGEFAGLVEGFQRAVTGGNTVADVAAQLPYLGIGPAAKGMGVAAKSAVPSVLNRLVTGEGASALSTRVAGISSVLEGAGGYNQTYARAISEGYSEEEAVAQAMKQGAVSAIAGAGLGKLTPGFELDPLGIKRNVTTQFLGDAVLPTLTRIGAEAIEEGGMAITNTVFDNILAGKDPMEGVGGAVGEAVAISSMFTGGMQAPGLIKDMSGAIGKGVVKALGAAGAAVGGKLADRAVTPQGEAVDAAAGLNGEIDPSVQAELDAINAQIAEIEGKSKEGTTQTVENPFAKLADAELGPAYEQLNAQIDELGDPAELKPGTPEGDEYNRLSDMLNLLVDEAQMREKAQAPTSDAGEVIQSTEPVAPSTDRRQDAAQRKAIEELSPEEKDIEIRRLRDAMDNPTDAVTGLIRSDTTGDDLNTPVQRALNAAVATSDAQEAHWMSFDIGNLGGLNDAVNNVAADANVHYRALVDIAQSTLTELGLSTKGFRTGGDEFGMIVNGAGDAVNKAIPLINERIAAYTKQNKLDQIPHPKGKAPGLQLHIGSTQVVPGDTVDTIRNRADRQLDASKKGKTDVRREPTETPREDAPNVRSEEDGGTGSTARSEVSGSAERTEKASGEKVTGKKKFGIHQYVLGLKARRQKKQKVDDNVATVLINARLELQKTRAKTRKESVGIESEQTSLEFDVEKSRAVLEKKDAKAVKAVSEAAAAGNEDAQAELESHVIVNVTAVPSTDLDATEQAVAEQIRTLADTGVDATSEQILETGFEGKLNSRGIRGYLQDIIGYYRIGGDQINEAANNLRRFVAHLEARAALFQAALDNRDNRDLWQRNENGTPYIDIEGTVTKSGKPFRLWVTSKNSIATAERAVEDARRARVALDTVRQRVPGMFPAVDKAPVVTQPAVTAPAAPTPTSAALITRIKELTIELNRLFADSNLSWLNKIPRPSGARLSVSVLRKNLMAMVTSINSGSITTLDADMLQAAQALIKIVLEQRSPAAPAPSPTPAAPARAAAPAATVTAKPLGKATIFRGGGEKVDLTTPEKGVAFMFFANTPKGAKEYGSKVVSKVVNLTEAVTAVFNTRADFVRAYIDPLDAADIDGTSLTKKDLPKLNALFAARTPANEIAEQMGKPLEEIRAIVKDRNAFLASPSALYKAANNYFATTDAKPYIQFSYPELTGTPVEIIYNPSLDSEAVAAGVNAEANRKREVAKRSKFFTQIRTQTNLDRLDGWDIWWDSLSDSDAQMYFEEYVQAEKLDAAAAKKLWKDVTDFASGQQDQAAREDAGFEKTLVALEKKIANGIAAAKDKRALDAVREFYNSNDGQFLRPDARKRLDEMFDLKEYEFEREAEAEAIGAALAAEKARVAAEEAAAAQRAAEEATEEQSLDDRLAQSETKDLLKQLVLDAHWEQVGGSIIREDNADYKSPVVDRTTWLNSALWWDVIPYREASNRVSLAEIKALVQKVVEGKKVRSNANRQRAILQAILDWVDEQNAAPQQEAPAQSTEEETPPPPEDEGPPDEDISYGEEDEDGGNTSGTTRVADVEVNPLTMKPLDENQSWFNTKILASFKLNPYKSVQAFLEKLRPGDLAKVSHPVEALSAIIEKELAVFIESWGLSNPDAEGHDALVEKHKKNPSALLMHAMVRVDATNDKPAHYKLHPEIMRAIALAAVMQRFRAPTRYTEDELIDPKTGFQIRDSHPHAWARNIAGDAMAMLGMKDEGSDSLHIGQGLFVALGLTAVDALIQGGAAKYGAVQLNEFTSLEAMTIDKEQVETILQDAGFADRLSKIIDGVKGYTASTSPITREHTTVKNQPDVPLTQMQNTALDNMEKVKHERFQPLVSLIAKVGQMGTNRLLTGMTLYDEEGNIRKDLPKAVKDYLQARMNGLRKELLAFNAYNQLLDEEAADGLYFEYDIGGNGRTTSYMGPAQYKLIRDAFTSSKTNHVLTNEDGTINEKAHRGIKYGIAQALGIKIEEAEVDVLTQFEAKAVAHGPMARQLVAMLADGDAGGQNVLDLLERDTPYSVRELAGLITLGEYLNAVDAKSKTITTFIPVEVDGKTNGAFNTEMGIGLWQGINKFVKANLEQGGLMLGRGSDLIPPTWAEMKAGFGTKYGALDLYLRVAIDAKEFLQKGLSKFGPKMQAQYRNMLFVTGMTKAGALDEFVRDASKRASNPTQYGAATGGVASQLVVEMKRSVINKWIQNHTALTSGKLTGDALEAAVANEASYEGWLSTSEEEWDAAARLAGKALLEAYKKNKPAVSVASDRLVKLTNFGFAVKMAQWRMQQKNVLATMERNEGIPETATREITRNGVKRTQVYTPPKWAPSKKSYRRMLANTMPMKFSTAVNPAGINLDGAQNAESEFSVRGAGQASRFRADLDVPMPKEAGVRVLAMAAISGGDGSMMMHYFQKPRKTTNVWDGAEMTPDMFDEDGTDINQSVWDTIRHDLLADFETFADNLLDWTQNITDEELKDAVVREWNAIQDKFAYDGQDPSELDYVLTGFNAKENKLVKDESGRFALDTTSFEGKLFELRNLMASMHKAQLEGLAELETESHYLMQMTNGGGYRTPAKPRVVREATNTTANAQKGWDKRVAAQLASINDKASLQSIQTILDGIRWPTRVQRYVWKKLRTILPANLSVTLARNEQEWNAVMGEDAKRRPYGSVLGLAIPDSNQIVLATTDPVILLHELMHLTFSTLIKHYVENIHTVPTAARGPINDLLQLLERFKSIPDMRLRGLQSQLWVLEDVWGDKASAVDELLAYTLTETKLIEAVQPGFVKRFITRVKNLFASILGKEVPTEFYDDALKSFENVVNLLQTNSQTLEPVMDTRDALNIPELDVGINKAYAALAQKAARGIKMHAKGTVATNHLQQVLTKFSLSAADQVRYAKVQMLLRADARPPEMEQFVATTLPKHPQANLFNGAADVTASVMALAAVDTTFAAQLETIYRTENGEPTLARQLLNRVMTGLPTMSVEALINSTFNANSEVAEYRMSMLSTAQHRLDRIGSEWMGKAGDALSGLTQRLPDKLVPLNRAIAGLLSEQGAETAQKSLLQFVNEMTDQRWLQALTADVLGSQKDSKFIYRQFKKMHTLVADTRAQFDTVLPKALKSLFPEDFDGWNTLFEHLGRLDISVLGTSAALMFKDNDARRKMITALESKISNVIDAKNLAYYLVHQKVDPKAAQPLLSNARAIADDVNSGKAKKAPDSLVTDVDQLVSLYAIDMLTTAERVKMSDYFTRHEKSMNNLLGMLQKVKEEDEKQYKDNHKYVFWKGALPLETDVRTSVVVAGVVDGARYEAMGYKKVQEFKKAKNDPAPTLHYYVRKYAPPPVFAQGILATVQQTAMGVNYTTAATITPEVGTMITKANLVEYITDNQGVGSNLRPIRNGKGQIVGYERLLDAALVRKLTGADNSQLHVAIGKKLGRIVEERFAKNFNQQAINILKQQWDMGVAEGIQAQYDSVNSTTDKQVARAWEVIPADVKKQLEDTFGGPVMIRKDLIHNTLGYHGAGLNDIYTGNASMDEPTRRALLGIIQTVFIGPKGTQILFAAESAIKEGVATAKDLIVVRTLSVAYSNFMASANLVIANGVPITRLAKYYRQGLREVLAYNRLQQEVIQLTVQIAGATGVEKARLETLQEGKIQAQKRLTIYPLVAAGELGDLPEGLVETTDASYLGDLSGWLNKHMRKIHPKMPMVAANLAIAKDSVFHETLSKAIQAGDFLGRYAIYQHKIETGKMRPEDAADEVRDEFVAYALNPGRFRGALEDYGLLWWSQFTIRTQKVLLRRFRQNPFSFFASMSLAGMTGTDGPYEMALTERGLDNSMGIDQMFGAASAHIWWKLF